MKTCDHCGATLTKRPNESHSCYATRRYCNRAHWLAATATPTPAPRGCLACGRTLTRRDDERMDKFASRTTCDRRCANELRNHALANRQEQQRGYIVSEVEHLAGTDSPERIATRLGFSSADALARMLYRWDRADLARTFGREVAA